GGGDGSGRDKQEDRGGDHDGGQGGGLEVEGEPQQVQHELAPRGQLGREHGAYRVMLWRVTISDFTGQPAPVETRGEPPRASGGRLAAEALKAAGVETIFTLAGGHIMKLLDACVPPRLRVIDTPHEGAPPSA